MANGIPSGYAPLFLGDLATPMNSVAQKLNRDMMMKLQQDKAKKSQDKAFMLKALDFETVQGLGRKVQEEHLKELNSFRDEVAKKYLEKGMKLSDEDYFNIQKRKGEIDQKIANMKFNVAHVANAQKEIMRNPNAYEWQSVQDLQKYVEEGNLGADASNILKPMFDVNKYLEENYGSRAIADMEETTERIPGTNKVRTVASNRKAVERLAQEVMQDPTLQAVIARDPKRYGQRFNAWLQGRLRESVKEDFADASLMKQWEMEKIPEESKEVAEKFGITDPKLLADQAKMKYIESQNTITQKMLAGDKKTLDMLEDQKIEGFGTVDRYEVTPSGNVRLISKETYDTGGKDRKGKAIKAPRTYDFPTVDWTNNDQVRSAKLTLKKFLPGALLGKHDWTGSSDYMFGADWEAGEVEKAPITIVKRVDEVMSSPRVIKKVEDGFADRGDMIQNLQYLFPDKNVEEKKTINSKAIITIDGDDYNLNTPADKDKIKAMVRDAYPDQFAKSQQTEDSDDTDNTDRDKQMTDREEFIKSGKESIVSKAKQLNVQSLSDYIDLLTKAGVSKEQIDKRIEEFGLTDQDFK